MESVHWELLRESPGFSSDIGATRSVFLWERTLSWHGKVKTSLDVFWGRGGLCFSRTRINCWRTPPHWLGALGHGALVCGTGLPPGNMSRLLAL